MILSGNGTARMGCGWQRCARLALLLAGASAATLIGCARHDSAGASAPVPAVQVAPPPTTVPQGATAYVNSSDSGTAAVSGTSTLHDWSAKSTVLNGSLICSGKWIGAAPTLDSIQLTIPVNSLHSSEGEGMDDNMYDALKSKADPNITFSLAQAKLKSAPTKDDPLYHYAATGQLTIAGYTRSIDLTLDIMPGQNDALTISTQTQMKMTDFNVKPPTAMLGMIKSGDAVTVNVTWRLTRPPK
jgi:polyisoprenoid-binding protein YceI